ncbi:MAG: N-formylglutamate amidohydrolase [Paracoccaceae bacterium]|nr:N-formylglutamate amidohydrolase [Paracoccaceae bacterium]
MSADAPPFILSPEDGPAAEVLNPDGAALVCMVCEHASARIPAALDDLGLFPKDRFSHAVWDIGARDLALGIATALDAKLVVSRVSRLVYDCNRPPDAPDAMPFQSERVAIPGNRNLTEDERAARTEAVYEPFRRLLSNTLDGYANRPTMLTLHSFAPVWHGAAREVQIGFVHDVDDSLAQDLLRHAPADLNVAINEPYSAADGVAHTLKEHATPRGLRNVMIEVRNDLISDAAGVVRIAEVLLAMLVPALAREAAE